MDGVILKQRAHSNPQPVSSPLESSISFRHPNYDDPEDILFTFPRLDSSAQAGAAAGVHHGTALLACQIVANNAFDGYLTADREGHDRVSLALDGVLLHDNYWFIVSREDAGVYPVVPRFEEWPFPHNHMESLSWNPKAPTVEPQTNVPERSMPAISSTTQSVIPSAPPPLSMSRCVLSNNPYAIQKAHIVPTAQSKWFQTNSMRRYGDSRMFIHTEQNKILMRHDLHKLWDDHVFALVPKRGGRDFVVHVLSIPKLAFSEFASEWHNTPVQEAALNNAGTAFLFAKFAQAVFMLFKPFIAFSAVPRRIATFQVRAEDDPRFPVESTIAWVSASGLSQRYSGGGSKSASASADSRKRSRSQASGAANENDEAEDSWYPRNVCARLWSRDSEEEEEAQWYATNIHGMAPPESEEDDGDNWYETNVAGEPSDEEERGRPRKRRRRRERSEHTVDTLPSLTDTSAAGDLEDMDHSGFLAPSTDSLNIHASKCEAVQGDVSSVKNAT